MTISYSSKGQDPIDKAVAVTPADGSDLAAVTRALWVGVTGDVKVTLAASGTVTLKNMTQGMIHPIRVTRVWATGTTATNIVALY